MSPTLAKGIIERRPFKSMVEVHAYLSQSVTAAQFRKEIGKYVDQKEVARLERYVTLQ